MAKGLTDAQLDAMDEMEARQNLYGTAARVLESPAAVPMTDAQMDQRATSDSLMQATPFGQKTMPQSAPQPPQADFREPPKPLTDAELNAQDDNLYYDPSYEMPFEEFAPVHARRQQEKNTVGSFVDGAVAAGQGLVSLTAEMGQELKDNATSNFYRPDRFATQNFVTLKEAGRKAGLEFAKLVDWIGNTARDHATDVRRQEQVRSVIAQKLQAEGKLSGDLRGDIEIINREFAAAKERGETAPTPLEENADVKQAFEDYRRGKNFDREIAGVGNFSIGQTPVTQESSEARATNPITGEVMEPQRALATGGSMALAPDNLLPVGAGALSKVRILRRLSSITGVPLKMTEEVANAGADALRRSAMRITDRVQDLTGMNAMQQTAAATALTGGVGYLSTQGQGAPAALGGVATGVLSILPIMKFGGAILRRTGATAGGGYAIVREMGAGGAGAAGAETAQAMAGSGAFPQRYARHMQPGGASVDSTLRRVAQDPENPQMLRRLSRTANNLGATQAFRLADDAVSSAVVSGLTAAPFALVAPDAEQGGQIVGGAVMLGTLAGTATRAFGRRPAEVDADIARMLVDVTESNGDAASLMSLSHDSLSQLAAMQGVLRNKVKFIPLRGQDYRANTDLRAEGGETAAGLYIEKDANGSARIFVNMGHTAPMDGKVSVRPDADKGGNVIDITAADGTVDSTHVPQGIRLLVKTGDAVSANQRLAQDLSPTRIVPHEIGHAILTSDILGGQPRNDLRNLVNQQYATDGVAARGREYATRLVDKDILVGAIEDAPVNLTEAQINDVSSGKTTLADVLKGQPVSEQARQRLIDQRVEELSQRSIEKGQDALDWARDEIIAETFASEAPAIDFRAIRRDAMFPRLAESMLSAGGRVLEVMGARLDPGTGKLMDNPSVLFRDNPLFQDRIMQKRVREYVRSYDQYLAGLEEAGAKELRGVELARSSKPDDLARSTHVKLRDEGRGVLENDFLFQKPDGTYSLKPQKIITATENARSAQIKTLYDARKFVPVNSQEFGKRKVNGREVIGGPVLPAQFDFFTHFPKYLRPDPTTGDIGLVRKIEASREDGGSWDIDVNVIGTGSSGRYRVINLGNTRAVQRETVPYGWIISKANHLLAASLDLNAFRASAMKAINKGDLGLFNNDMRQVEADLKTYLANHRNGMPGEMTIGQQKRDMLNGLIGTGTAVQRTANPLYSDLNPRGSIRTWRVDRLNDAKPTGRTGYFFDYDKINQNRMPSALPQVGMAMPDVPVVRGQAMPDITITPDEARRRGLVGPVYHGSPDFKGRKFDPKYRARSSGISRGGFSFSDDVASADGYAAAPVDSAQAAVDSANDVMREAAGRMERGLKVKGFSAADELPEFNVRYVDDISELSSYFNELAKDMPKDLAARLRDAAKQVNEPANPVVVEAYLRNPKTMDINGKKLLLVDNPDDIFVSAARPPQGAATGGTRGQAMPDVADAGDQGVAMPKGTVTQLTNTARKALPRLPRGAKSVPKLVIKRKDKPDAVVDGGNPKSWKDYADQHLMPLPNIKLDKVKGVSFSKQDIYGVAQTDRARAQANAQQSVQAAALAAADPLKFVDAVGYSEIMRASGVVGDILIPPSGLKLMLTDPAAFVGLLDGGFHGKRTVPGTRAAALQGLDGVTEMRQLVGGQPSSFNTALHHFWGTLSKQLDVINQEAAWMRLVLDPAIIEAIEMSIAGKFSMQPKAWEALVAKALDGTHGDFRGKGNNAKANANSFYKALVYHNGRWDEVAALYANNNAIDMRAQFNALGHGKVGMKNKVQGFVGLSFGIKGSVLDRWRFVDLYLPDAMGLTGAATPEQYFKYVGAQKIIPQDPIGIYKNYGTLENGNPAFSLALYNSLDSVAQVAINNSPELRNYLGAHADPGGLHWVTWNSIKNEAVGHSSLDITKNFVRQYGRNGTASDFARFMRTAEGFVEGSNDAGQITRISLKNGVFSYSEQ